MRTRTIVILVALLSVILVIAVVARRNKQGEKAQQNPTARPETARAQRAQHVPAYYTTPPSLESLAPVLPPDQFTGKTREAYQAVKEIPQTIAQMPCYCNCDESFGHKSLHSCFEGTHASQCAVCVGEALTAYRLQKEQKLSPAEIRERIIAEYSRL